MRDGGRAERAFPVAANTYDGAMGPNGVHQTFTAATSRATTHLSNQRNEVSLYALDPPIDQSRITSNTTDSHSLNATHEFLSHKTAKVYLFS